MTEPERLVFAFIEDHCEWNKRAFALDKKFKSMAAVQEAKLVYSKLLAKYCWPDFVGEPIAYGSRPFHDPEREVIVGFKESQLGAVVTTIITHPDGFQAEYEYVFAREDDRWYLCAVDFMDPDGGRYPSL